MIDAPGTAEHGLFARDAEGRALVHETVTEHVVPCRHQGRAARPCPGACSLRTVVVRCPSFQLLAEKYLDEEYAPEAVATETGIAAETIRGLAAEIARVAFDEAISIDQPWTDINGERHQAYDRPAGRRSMPCAASPPIPTAFRRARAASAAGADRLGRLSRRLSFRAALPEADFAASDASMARPSISAPTSR